MDVKKEAKFLFGGKFGLLVHNVNLGNVCG